MVLSVPSPERYEDAQRRVRRSSAHERCVEAPVARQGGAWTPGEDARLVRLHDEGAPFARMVVAHQRSPRDIRGRLARLQPWAKGAGTARAGARWSRREEERLIREHGASVPLATMAACHGRPADEIMEVLAELEPWRDGGDGAARRSGHRAVGGGGGASSGAEDDDAASVEVVPGANGCRADRDGLITSGVDLVWSPPPLGRASVEPGGSAAEFLRERKKRRAAAGGRRSDVLKIERSAEGLYALRSAYAGRAPRGLRIRAAPSLDADVVGVLRPNERAVVSCVVDGWAAVDAVLRGVTEDAPWAVAADSVSGWTALRPGGGAGDFLDGEGALERVGAGAVPAALVPAMLNRLDAEARALGAADAPKAAYALSREYDRLARRIGRRADDDAPRGARGGDDGLAGVRRCAVEEVGHQRAEFHADADAYAESGDSFKTWYAGKLYDLKDDERADILSPASATALSPLAYRAPTPPDGPGGRGPRGDDDPAHWWRPRGALFAKVALE